MTRAFIPGWTWLASIAVHGVLVAGVGWLAFHSLARGRSPGSAPSPSETPIALDLPAFAEGTLRNERPPNPAGDPLERSPGATIPRVDTGHAGHGGDATVDKPAVHLSDVDERMRLSSALLDRLDRDQVQRIHSGADRASREDRRSTTHPMELTFLASGRGDRAERRAPNETDPNRGALVAERAAVSGGDLGSPEPSGEGLSPASPAVGGERLGTASGSPGIGVRNAPLGADHRASARVTTARPDVTLGPVAVEALHKARPNDDVDSDQEVATAVRSLVHASTSGGLAGQGSGGSGGGGDPGAGGLQGAGSHPLPLGSGDGDWLDLDTTDPRLVPYFRRVHAKVEPLWADAFPRSAMLDLKQGTVILEFTIAPDGTVRVNWPPARPSGIDEFDRNCANAIRKASPFEPLPKELGRASLRIRAPFVAVNPIVR